MRSSFWILIPAMLTGLFLLTACEDEDLAPTNPLDMPYEVVIDPADFIDSDITGNEFFPITPGSTYVYLGEDEDGEAVRVEEEHTTDTKVIMGITCVVVNAREFVDGEPVENTYDWYAQDTQGNMWYFGEHSEEIEDGQVVGTGGSWEAGVDGALPGIIMLAHPIEGLWYRQEYYEGEAEDVAQVLSLSATVDVPYGNGTFTNCLQTAEWNPMEPEIMEHKFYASGVGLLRAVAVKGESGYEDLVSITSD
ncbi:MAG: hypothetical protein JSW54_05765 [Fidelibacterota bacterium]|nr:MAG: hypothetical protein JSW54_05765 [Candidatus Neomarinimicrobiota bacterium]